jgi:hypothetical protein
MSSNYTVRIYDKDRDITIDTTLNSSYYNIGNEYAKIKIEDSDREAGNRFAAMNYSYDTILSYYNKRRGGNVLLDQDSFLTDYYNSESDRYSYIKLYKFQQLGDP